MPASVLRCVPSLILLGSLCVLCCAYPKCAPSWLETLYQQFIADFTKAWGADHHALLFTFMVIVPLELVFWSINLALTIISRLGLFQQYRLQTHSAPPELIREALQDAIVGHLFLRPPLIFLTYKLGLFAGPALDQPLPGAPTLLVHLFACMWIDDTYFYWSHRLCHHRWIYKRIHKKHHAFHQPVGICTEYSHPLEDLFVNAIGTIAGPILLRSHAIVLIVYLGLKLAQSVDAHSGYDLPCSPFSVLRSMDCAPAHDFHHSHNTGMYGGWFIFWDWLCGTDASYVRFLGKKRTQPAYRRVMWRTDVGTGE